MIEFLGVLTFYDFLGTPEVKIWPKFTMSIRSGLRLSRITKEILEELVEIIVNYRWELIRIVCRVSW